MKNIELTDAEYGILLQALIDMIFYYVNDPSYVYVRESDRKIYLKEAKKLKGIYNKLLGSEFFKEIEE